MVRIEILRVTYDGYEQIIEFIMQDDPKHIMWAHMISYDEYIENGTKQCNPTESVEASFTVELVMNIKKVIEAKSSMAIQEIENSSHVKCVGIVKSVIAPDSIMCNVGTLGNVIVELEKPNSEIVEGMQVEFTGNLELQII